MFVVCVVYIGFVLIDDYWLGFCGGKWVIIFFFFLVIRMSGFLCGKWVFLLLECVMLGILF